MRRYFLWTALLAAPFLPGQDSLQLTDGRFVTGHKMSKHEDGILIQFNHGKIVVPQHLVKTSTVLSAEENERQWTQQERKKLERGLVLFEGRWIKEEFRAKKLEERRTKRSEKIAEAKKHRKWVDRYKLETRNFAFEYTIDPEVMAEYAEMMEVYFKAFTKEWKIKKPSKLGRLKVHFYHDEEYYQQVSGAPSGVIGYFRFVPPLELVFFYDRLEPRMTTDVMFHETNHYLTHLIDTRFHYPSWINESLAEYYGASEWDPEKKEMVTGKLQEGRLAVVQDAIKRDKWQGLEDLIRIPHGQFNATHYAWGWTFVHYLLSSPKYHKRFKRFYIGLAKDSSIKRKRWSFNMVHAPPEQQLAALKKYLKIKDLKSLEKEWHDYVRGLDVASHRGLHRAGQIALARGMPIKAQRFFRTALEMGSLNPKTHYGYSRALSRKGKWAEAEVQLRLAIKGDPLNGLFYVHLADALERISESNEREATRLRKLALEIEPDNYTIMLEVARAGIDL